MATTTPNYGWDVPTSTDYVKDGATAIETLGDDIDATLYSALGGNYPGLRLVKKQTIGSAVTSVNVTGAFSATYNNYKILIDGGVGSGTVALRLQLGNSTTAYYAGINTVTYATGVVVNAFDNNAARWSRVGFVSSNTISANIDLINPAVARETIINNSYVTLAVAGTNAGYHGSSTAYTDFTISPDSGTITGGTIYVYGYGAS
jgi:hypothetical protein